MYVARERAKDSERVSISHRRERRAGQPEIESMTRPEVAEHEYQNSSAQAFKVNESQGRERLKRFLLKLRHVQIGAITPLNHAYNPIRTELFRGAYTDLTRLYNVLDSPLSCLARICRSCIVYLVPCRHTL